MKVFHGSDTFIEKVDLSKSQPGRDFGRGFYVTKFYRQAQNMAERVAQWHTATPIITEFDFDEFAFDFDELKTLRFDAYNEAWLDFIVICRRNKSYDKTSHDYDLVEGPVADDAVTIRIDDYLRGAVSKADFLKELAFKRPSHQICFCTFQSLLMLTRPNYRAENYIFHIDDLVVQQLVIDFEMSERQASDVYFNSAAYRTLIDESTGLHREPWTETYRQLLPELKRRS